MQAARLVNTELVVLYWRIGTLIRQRRAEEGWGTKVVDRLAADLRAAFPEHAGVPADVGHPELRQAGMRAARPAARSLPAMRARARTRWSAAAMMRSCSVLSSSRSVSARG